MQFSRGLEAFTNPIALVWLSFFVMSISLADCSYIYELTFPVNTPIYDFMEDQSRIVTDTPKRRGPPKQYHERKLVTLPAGTLARLTAVCEATEDLMDLIRAAVEREIKRRERAR